MRRKRIVAVDDSEDILFTISAICRTRGYEVIPCESYTQVKQYIYRRDIDLYLVDYHLPGKDGIDVVKLIREANKTVPIMMLTVESSDIVAQKVKEAGANDFALKPIKALDFLSRVDLHLSQSQQFQYYADRSVGVNETTLKQILAVMEQQEDYLSAEEIALLAEISIKSIYRYLKYLEDQKMILIKNKYDKPGRPRNLYKLNQPE